MKNSKHVQKKLNLSRESVRLLSADHLQQAAGGKDGGGNDSDPCVNSPTAQCIPTVGCTEGC